MVAGAPLGHIYPYHRHHVPYDPCNDDGAPYHPHGSVLARRGAFCYRYSLVDKTNMGIKILLCVINIIAGILILIYPLFSALFVWTFFVIFIGFWACFIGAVHLYQAFTSKDVGNGVLGLLSLIFGILLLVNPFIAAALLPFVAGGFTVVAGISVIVVSFGAKKAQAATAP